MDSKFIEELKITLERLENDRDLYRILWNNYGHIFGNQVSIFLLLKSAGIFMSGYLTNYSQVDASHVRFMAWISDEFENLPNFTENESKSKPVEMFYAISLNRQRSLIEEYNRMQSY